MEWKSLFNNIVGFLVDVNKFRPGEEQFNFESASVYEIEMFHVWKICDSLYTVILATYKVPFKLKDTLPEQF